MPETQRPPLTPADADLSRKYIGRFVPTARRFWAKVEVQDGCWLWLGRTDRLGYGHFDLGGRAVMAHRFAYQLLRGPIPDDLELDHVKERGCASRACVRPAHLEPVTHLENVRRGVNASRTHCRNGHLYDATNTYRTPQGRRSCRECHRANNRTYDARHKERRHVA